MFSLSQETGSSMVVPTTLFSSPLIWQSPTQAGWHTVGAQQMLGVDAKRHWWPWTQRTAPESLGNHSGYECCWSQGTPARKGSAWGPTSVPWPRPCCSSPGTASVRRRPSQAGREESGRSTASATPGEKRESPQGPSEAAPGDRQDQRGPGRAGAEPRWGAASPVPSAPAADPRAGLRVLSSLSGSWDQGK